MEDKPGKSCLNYYFQDAPYYMPISYPKYKRSDIDFITETCESLKIINSEFSDKWIQAATVSRHRYAQTIFTRQFHKKLPPMKSKLKGFYMADTAYYYPEDRCISESLRIGKELAKLATNE